MIDVAIDWQRSEASRRVIATAFEASRPAAKARAVRLDRGAGAQAALRAVVASCLEQIVANASPVALGTYDGEHVHQLRIGLRRLRSALRFFDGWTNGIDPTWRVQITGLFRDLGAARDSEVLTSSVMPMLRNAHAPEFRVAPTARPDPTTLVGSASFSHLLFELMTFVSIGRPLIARANPMEPAAAPMTRLTEAFDLSASDFLERVDHRLARWHRQVKRRGEQFASLDTAARHGLRKRIKRLRYAVEFVRSLYRHKAVDRYLKQLAPAQESLGRYNDLVVALDICRSAANDDPRAWFAVGWLASQHDVVLARCTEVLGQFSQAKPFWNGR